MAPLISVLMGIYNCADTLPVAIDSILNQTVQDFELILCEDGSSDDTYAVAADYQRRYPDKIVLLKNEHNLGLNLTLNRCLAVAKGEFIARMDGDDVCDPTRFEKELAVLRSRPDVAFVGTTMYLFDDNGIWGITRPLAEPKPKTFSRGNPFSHGSCMVRRSAYDAMGGYSEDPRVVRVEDFHLWMRMYEAGMKGVNILEPLYALRSDFKAAGRRRMKARWNEAYVTWISICRLKVPKWRLILSLRPLLLGLLPRRFYLMLHKRKRALRPEEIRNCPSHPYQWNEPMAL